MSVTTDKKMTGQGRPVETIAKHRSTCEEKRRDMPLNRTGTAGMYLREGDLVVDEETGAIGLLTRLGIGAIRSLIEPTNGDPAVECRRWRTIRQLSPTEIMELELGSVDCNPYRGRR